MKIVLIKWVDAASVGGWRSKKAVKEFIKKGLDSITSVGMLVQEDNQKVTIIQTDGINQVIGLFEIPRGCIKSIKVLGKV